MNQRAFFLRKSRPISAGEHDDDNVPYRTAARVMGLVNRYIEAGQRNAARSGATEDEVREALRVLSAAAELKDAIFSHGDDRFRAIEKAFLLGHCVAEAHTLQFESDFRTGHKIKESARQGGGHNRIPDETVRQWQEKADAIWSDRPRLSLRSVAELISKSIGGDSETIRRRITKPG